MEIHDLLQIEDTVQTTKQGAQCDQYNYFVTSNKKLSDQIFLCKNIIDRLIDPPPFIDTKRKSLWLHASGGLAIDRASELALTLCHRIYPNLLSLFTYTDTVTCNEERIRVTADGEIIETLKPSLKSSIHIRISLAESPLKDPPSLQLSVQNNDLCVTHVA
ncbi:unnamed protein product [Hymenolepis diminuta]|uniref:Uncharacterized protein n=1 Tax=Hymenolepis diminuta TaxID=6216 RepID=A0A564YJR8_HYMDI|nr:unnamed protein product [Hymenolepis diminuta]